MAMNANALGTKWATDILGKAGLPASGEVFTKMESYYQMLATDMVDHITTNAVVPSGISVNAGGYSGSTIETGKVT
ncbi:hypothetical protein AGMMS50268_13250 [Spirochaetia bacterium]|nr:hypothetical protein AGMMS50268_13250 [Spirochaetia bacterium]